MYHTQGKFAGKSSEKDLWNLTTRVVELLGETDISFITTSCSRESELVLTV